MQISLIEKVAFLVNALWTFVFHTVYFSFRFSKQNRWENRPFPSSLVPLLQNEFKCETLHMKMSSSCSFILMQIKLIFIRMVSHLDSFWNRGTRELGNGLIWSRKWSWHREGGGSGRYLKKIRIRSHMRRGGCKKIVYCYDFLHMSI